MSILSDHTIKELVRKGVLGITPFKDESVQPSSYDVRLKSDFRIFNKYKYECIDPGKKQPNLTYIVTVPAVMTEPSEQDAFVLHPGDFVLGETVERVKIPDFIVARLEGKSSLGRLGLVVHSTAGFIDPGFEGTLTLELSNVSGLPMRLYPGMKIGQLSFQTLSTPADMPYGSAGLGSKYQGQSGPTESRLYREVEKVLEEIEEDERLEGDMGDTSWRTEEFR